MNNIFLGVAGVLLVVVLFVLFDEPEAPKPQIAVDNSAREVKQEAGKPDVSISYEKTEKPEKKVAQKAPEPKAEREDISAAVEDSRVQARNIITARGLKTTRAPKGQEIVFSDKDDRYDARVMLPEPSANYKGIPMIPVAVSLQMPSGEKINAHVDPMVLRNNSEAHVYVQDKTTGMEYVVDISQDVIDSRSGSIINLQVDSQGRVSQTEKVTTAAPPMPNF